MWKLLGFYCLVGNAFLYSDTFLPSLMNLYESFACMCTLHDCWQQHASSCPLYLQCHIMMTTSIYCRGVCSMSVQFFPILLSTKSRKASTAKDKTKKLSRPQDILISLTILELRDTSRWSCIRQNVASFDFGMYVGLWGNSYRDTVEPNCNDQL